SSRLPMAGVFRADRSCTALKSRALATIVSPWPSRLPRSERAAKRASKTRGVLLFPIRISLKTWNWWWSDEHQLCGVSGRTRNLFRGSASWHHSVHHWIAELLPFVETAQQRTHVTNAVLSQLQRHTGAGRFVWSSAEEHDLTVAGDFAVPALEFLRRDLQRSGQSSRIAQHVQRMTQVNNDDLLARFQLMLQFIRSNAVALDLTQETLPLAPPVQDIGNNAGDVQHQDPAAEALSVKVGAIHLLAEDEAEPGKSARPKQCPEKIKEKEPREIDAHHARQSRCRRVQAGYELANEQRARPELGKRSFGAANARVRLESDAAEQIEHHSTAALSEEVPERVGNQRSKRWNERGQREMHPALCCERSSGQQQRRGWNGQTALLDQHPEEQQGIAVTNHELERFSHRRDEVL